MFGKRHRKGSTPLFVRDIFRSFDDEESLPYVSAIVNEVLRWKPVTPIG
jgi:cytochrome P450